LTTVETLLVVEALDGLTADCLIVSVPFWVAGSAALDVASSNVMLFWSIFTTTIPMAMEPEQQVQTPMSVQLQRKAQQTTVGGNRRQLN
jgi:hypothetical protein